MRNLFGTMIADAMEADDRIWLLTGDLGFGVLDEARERVPERFANVGAAEQLMLGTAVGLAQNGKIPVVYSITPFVIFRPYEYLRNYLNHEMANVKLVGAGRDQDYGSLGFSHWADDAQTALRVFPHIRQYFPAHEKHFKTIWDQWLYHDCPSFLSLRRSI